MAANSNSGASETYVRSGSLLERIPPEIVGNLFASAADIALIVDSQGIIQDLSFNTDELNSEGYDHWRGKAWIDTVTVESRPKVHDLLTGAVGRASTNSREINHPSRQGIDLSVRYSAVRMDPKGSIIAIGRDMRNISALQQRLIETQQAMEREYSRMRQAETRYRMLFHVASEPVIIVDSSSLRIVEANPAALRCLAAGREQINGQPVPEFVDARDVDTLKAMLASARQNGRSDDVSVRLRDNGHQFNVSASLFRKEQSSFLLLRLASVAPVQPTQAGGDVSGQMKDILEQLPDGFIVADENQRVIEVNQAFLDLAQLSSKKQALGEPLERFLGRPGVDMPIVMQGLSDHGTVHSFSTVVRGQFGGMEEVEVSGVSTPNGAKTAYGFVVRSASRRTELDGHQERALPRSVERLTELVGRVPLKDLVKETTDVIEKLCIEAALELSKDNRASAAQMLGLSRQSLYAKLRRFGLGDLDDDDSADD
jgi:transcriptional regulator PpsR